MICVSSDKKLIFNEKTYPCSLGKSGITSDKREGDGASPMGTYRLKYGFYRADRLEKPESLLDFTPLSPNDGWCDDPTSKQYNRKVQLPFKASHEELWRDDCIYDIIVVLSHNDQPPVPDKGSAIFFHLAHPDYRPTEGCIAISLTDMKAVLKDIRAGEEIQISK